MLLLSTQAHAAAFLLQEQSTKASGRAFAGGAAAADDASTIFYNPAGLTELRRPEMQIGAYVIAPHAEISNNGSSASVLGAPFAVGGDSGQGFDPQPIGNLYLAAPLADGLVAGLGVTVPFGLQNHYDNDFFGRYDSLRTTLRVIDIAPSIGYAIHPRVSIGGGIDVQYADAKLVNALPNPFDPSGPNPASDGLFTVEGSDWSAGFNVGVLTKPMDGLRVGVTYRSAVTHEIEGDATTEILGTKSTQAFTADLKLPDIVSLGIAYDLTPTVTLLGQANYYNWSRFDEIRISLADGTEPTTEENFRDSWGVALGAEYKVSHGWVLRTGVTYDQTPTRDAFRSTIMPDADRLWVAVGASYQFSDTVALDMSYTHMFEKEEPINRTNNFPALGTVVQTSGTTKTSADIVGLTLRMQF